MSTVEKVAIIIIGINIAKTAFNTILVLILRFFELLLFFCFKKSPACFFLVYAVDYIA